MFLPWVWVMQFATDLLVGQAATFNLTHCLSESVRVVFLSPIVVAKRLFVKVAEQVKRLNTDVGSMKGTLQEAPEILHRVGMNRAVHVLNGMVNNLVGILPFQSFV